MGEHKYPPTIKQWDRFVASRTGLLPLDGIKNIQVLCLGCGAPVDISRASKIRVGCVVSILVETDVEIDGQIYEELKRNYVPISTQGHGCQDCDWLMVKIAIGTGLLNKIAFDAWLRKGVVSKSPTPRQAWIEVDPRDVEFSTTIAAYKR